MSETHFTRDPELIASLRESLKKAKEKEGRLAAELEAFRSGVIVPLRKALEVLGGLDAEPTLEPTRIPTSPKDNLEAVARILRENGRMRRKEIASLAFSRKLILSSNGESGVDSIVGNILSRHEPHLFTNIGWGWWDLSEKVKPRLQVADPSGTSKATPIAASGLVYRPAESVRGHRTSLPDKTIN